MLRSLSLLLWCIGNAQADLATGLEIERACYAQVRGPRR